MRVAGSSSNPSSKTINSRSEASPADAVDSSDGVTLGTFAPGERPFLEPDPWV